ncbi:hypothetical protein ACFYUK_21105 [Nonomuraea wenchangensis]
MKVLVVGLPGSGKTSLIARSWRLARDAGIDFRLPWTFPGEETLRGEIGYERTHRHWGVPTGRERLLQRQLTRGRIDLRLSNAASRRRLHGLARAARRGRMPAGAHVDSEEWWLPLTPSNHLVLRLVDVPWTDVVANSRAALAAADGIVLTVDIRTPDLDGWRTTRTLVNCLQAALPPGRRIPVVLALTGWSRKSPGRLSDGLLTYLAAAESAGRVRGLTVPIATHGWRPRNGAVPIAWLMRDVVPPGQRPTSHVLTTEVCAGAWPASHTRFASLIDESRGYHVLAPQPVRVAVLGAPGAGRTALLAAMNRGLDPSSGLWLHLPQYAQHHALADMWDGVVGGVPTPSPEDTRYTWTLVDGAVPLMTVDWYEPRTPAVGDQTSVIVTFDASHLRDPVTPSTVRHVAAGTGADEINRVLAAQIATRRASGSALPFVIIVVTKTDLIRRGDGYSRSRAMLVDDLAQLLPDVFAAEDLVVAITTTAMPRPAQTGREAVRAAGTELLAYLLFWHSLQMGQEAMSRSRSRLEKERDDHLTKAEAARDKADSWNERLGLIGRAIGGVYGRKAEKAHVRARESGSDAQSAASVIQWAAAFQNDLARQLAQVTWLRGGVPFVPDPAPGPQEGA